MDDKKMEELKEEYMNVQPPKDGIRKLEETISRAKKDKKRTARLHYFRNAAAGMAAMFAGVFVMVNVNADIAHAMGEFPIIGGIIKVITLNQYQEEQENYHADIKVPKLEGEEESEGIQKVNEAVKKDTDALIAQCKEEFENETGKKGVDADYDVITDTKDWFTLRLSIVETQAGAQQMERYYNINRRTGKMVTSLSELFQEGSDYITPISENIKEQMREQMKADKDKIYWLDSEEGFEETDFAQISENQNFYLNETGSLVISFDEYEVAPGFMGAVTFEIPQEVISLILK